MMPHPIGLRLDDEDLELPAALAVKEKLSRSDVIRRAIRAYAVTLGVTPPEEEKKTKPKSKKE